MHQSGKYEARYPCKKTRMAWEKSRLDFYPFVVWQGAGWKYRDTANEQKDESDKIAFMKDGMLHEIIPVAETISKWNVSAKEGNHNRMKSSCGHYRSNILQRGDDEGR